MPTTVPPASVPFIENQTSSVSGTIYEPQNYCTNDSVVDSKYHLNVDFHSTFQRFHGVLNGVDQEVYCLDRVLDGPDGIFYTSDAFPNVFPGVSSSTKYALDWILANTYPSVSAAQTFALAGVDASTAPVLDDNDAYAVVQTAVWFLRGELTADQVRFLNCPVTEDSIHTKNDRLVTAVFNLVNMATAFGEYVAFPSAAQTSAAYCCNQAACECAIQCCTPDVAPDNPAEPYIIFAGCPYEISCVCGRTVVGPFILNSNVTGTPTITVASLYACDARFAATFVDFCGEPITPSLGQEFYIAVRSSYQYVTLTVTVSISGTATQISYLATQALNYQRMGSAQLNVPISTSTSLTFSFAINSSSYSSTSNVNMNTNVNGFQNGWFPFMGGYGGNLSSPTNININNNDNNYNDNTSYNPSNANTATNNNNNNNNNNNSNPSSMMPGMPWSGCGWPQMPIPPWMMFPPQQWMPQPCPPDQFPPQPWPPGPYPPDQFPPQPWPPGPCPPDQFPPQPCPPGPCPPDQFPPQPWPPGPCPPGQWPPRPCPSGQCSPDQCPPQDPPGCCTPDAGCFPIDLNLFPSVIQPCCGCKNNCNCRGKCNCRCKRRRRRCCDDTD